MKSTVKYVQSLERKAFFTRNVRIPQRSPAPVVPRDERSTQGEDRGNTLTFLRLKETLEPKPFTLSALRHMREVDRSEIGLGLDRNTGTTQSQSSCVSSVDVPDSSADATAATQWVHVVCGSCERGECVCRVPLLWCDDTVSFCGWGQCSVVTRIGDQAPTGVQAWQSKRATCLWCTSPREIVSGSFQTSW